MRQLIKHSPSERGQALFMIVVIMILLIGATALAVDGGNVFVQRRNAQNAVDNAALAGALTRIRGGNWVDIAMKTAAKGGYNNDKKTNWVRVVSPPISGAYKGNVEYIQVIIEFKTNTYFARIAGYPTIDSRVEAESRTKTPEWIQIMQGNAVVSLAPTSNCLHQKSFSVSGESTLDIEGGGIFINSNNPQCALETFGNGSIRIKGGVITVVGGASIRKPQLITPFPPQTGGVSISYPPPFMMPKVSCKNDAVVSEDGKNMTAGNWDEDVFPPDGVTGLNAGAYCINGDVIINGPLEGSGVTLKVEHGKVQIAAGAVVKLSSPRAGQNAGLLLYMPIDNKNLLILNGAPGSVYGGTILAPGADIRLKGNESAFGFHSQIIGYTIVSDGNSNIVIKYIDGQNYNALTMPEIQLSK